MAKVQSLSLNPTKISGICGRLMCCLKYENDIYNELKKGMPDVGERIKTPDGIGKVVETVLLEDKIKVRLYMEESKGKKQSEDEEEKLSPDIYVYKKEEIRRIDRRRDKSRDNDSNMFEGMNEEERKELEKLIKD